MEGGDDGRQLPNPTAVLKLDKLGIHFPRDKIGTAYGWAQRVAGLAFPGLRAGPVPKVDGVEALNYLQTVFLRIHVQQLCSTKSCGLKLPRHDYRNG